MLAIVEARQALSNLNEAKILEMAKVLFALPKEDQIDLETNVNHYIADGVYTRESIFPAGSFIIGKKHKKATINIVSKGRALVHVEEGKPLLAVEAPYTFVSPAGAQKVGYFFEDTIWINSFATDEMDLEKIQDEIIINQEELLWE